MNFKNPAEVEKELVQTTDTLGMPIDKGIFRACVILNSLGYKTRQSCEGHRDNYTSYPWVDIILESSEYFYKTLFQDLKEFYKTRNSTFDEKIVFEKFRGKTFQVRLSQLQNSKCFKDKRDEKLKSYLQEINYFCEFLNKKYNLNY